MSDASEVHVAALPSGEIGLRLGGHEYALPLDGAFSFAMAVLETALRASGGALELPAHQARAAREIAEGSERLVIHARIQNLGPIRLTLDNDAAMSLGLSLASPAGNA